jgi:hypothetical protein
MGSANHKFCVNGAMMFSPLQLSRLCLLLIVLTSLANSASAKNRNVETCEMSSIFIKDQHEAFQRDGFPVVSNLIDDELIDQLSRIAKAAASDTKNNLGNFSVLKKGVIFNGGIGVVGNETKTVKTNEIDEKTMEDLVDDTQELVSDGLLPVLNCSMSEVAPDVASKLDEKRREGILMYGRELLFWPRV